MVIACYFKNGNHEAAIQWQIAQQKAGIEIDILYADIGQFNDCEKLVSLVMERYGRTNEQYRSDPGFQFKKDVARAPKAWHLK